MLSDWYIHHVSVEITHKLDKIISLLQSLIGGQMATLDELKTQVTANTDVEQSALLLLNQLHQMLIDARVSNDPAQFDAVISQLGASKEALAAAIKANTV